jgi:hypothetical protein
MIRKRENDRESPKIHRCGESGKRGKERKRDRGRDRREIIIL